jgi:hypothetical protein
VSQQSSEPQESPEQGDGLSVPDDQLPEDLQPTEDNPLAQPADDDVADDAVIEGFGPAGSNGGSEGASASGNDDESDTSSSGAPSEADPEDDDTSTE